MKTTTAQAGCDLCASFRASKKQAVNDKEREAIQANYKTHLKMMFADRTCYARICHMSAMATAPNLGDSMAPDQSCLSLVIDGADQSEFKAPRNQPSAKKWDTLLRLQQRLFRRSAQRFQSQQHRLRKARLQLQILQYLRLFRRSAQRFQSQQHRLRKARVDFRIHQQD